MMDEYGKKLCFSEEGLPVPVCYYDVYNGLYKKTHIFNWSRGYDDFYLVKTKFKHLRYHPSYLDTLEITGEEYERMSRDGYYLEEVIAPKTRDGVDKFDFKGDDYKKLLDRIDYFSNELWQFILHNGDNPKKILLLGIPSSTPGVYNVPQFVINDLELKDKVYHSLSELYRVHPVRESHSDDNRKKTYDEVVGDTVKLCPPYYVDRLVNNEVLNEFDAIYLVDDVLTTGATFRNFVKLLNETYAVPLNKIRCFAFYKYIKALDYEGVVEKAERKKFASKNIEFPYKPMDIIFDIDGTIVDSRDRNNVIDMFLHRYKESTFIRYSIDKMKSSSEKADDYIKLVNENTWHKPFKNMDKVFDLFLPYLGSQSLNIHFMSNRSLFYKNIFISSVSNRFSNLNLMRGTFSNKFLLAANKAGLFNLDPYYESVKVKNHEGKVVDKKNYPLKPDLRFFNTFNGMIEPRTVIAIGNTREDILAYNAMGFRSVLVRYGNIGPKETYDADYVFDSVDELYAFLKSELAKPEYPYDDMQLRPYVVEELRSMQYFYEIIDNDDSIKQEDDKVEKSQSVFPELNFDDHEDDEYEDEDEDDDANYSDYSPSYDPSEDYYYTRPYYEDDDPNSMDPDDFDRLIYDDPL